MRKILTIFFLLIFLSITFSQEDKHLWLENVQGKKALDWVKKQNKESTSVLEKVEDFKDTYNNILAILNSKERIPYVGKREKHFYNFWQDQQHTKGILRRTTLQEYQKGKPNWETVLDLDALAKKEKENWVYKGTTRYNRNLNRSLLKLSRGGADATVIREFDMGKKSFVAKGFTLPEAKTFVSWQDENTLYVGTNFGKDSLSKSGYPLVVKQWKRGTALKDAKTIFKAGAESVLGYGMRLFTKDDHIDLMVDAKTFYKSNYYILQSGALKKLDIPENANIAGYIKKQLILNLKSDWKVGKKVYKQGSVVIAKLDDIISGKKQFQTLVAPGPRSSVYSVSITQNTILITTLENVASKILQFTQSNGTWQKKYVPVGDNGALSVLDTSERNDDYFVLYRSFITPSSLYMVSNKNGIKKLKSLPNFFDPDPYQVKQIEATSKDGTKIPYFIIRKKDMPLNGNNPTLLYGYGGFQISLRPNYLSTRGNAWLAKGGVYVQANIRGGGEFGPKWHQAGLKKNRHKVFEDFIAVAEDLIARKITSPKKLAIQGGSNGGLLVGSVFLKRPDLFKAVVCQVPLLDMKRYNKLLAGASWMSEYGNPDKPDEWAYIKTYSPYHNVKKGAKYPSVFFTTSTRDDRVHPGHARKMVAKMKDMGYKVYYYENIEGGHAGAANQKQRAYVATLVYAYLYKQLMQK